ncbi:RluA family pseudouridine synthase [Vagococcus sp. DIV0080]|uniref:Pseudouridine synthase n=1 Tax=Candidatus Vagococcus giribetii TaxID=2230876 RepID=A0ABS3HUD0_9ENTE|nr:RluA family pseudouridine synthase [Vagococcus sp. DIV0080]MBO0476436.1 RluA family pseudouridine synthase [Vagococcus sp. DIV0080]
MEFVWQVTEESVKLKTFLKSKGVSKKLLAKIKFHGGEMSVNDQIQNALYMVVPGDEVKIVIPDEGEHETLIPYEAPIDIVFEDDHFLVVNKPKQVASIPAQYHPVGTMAHRVKHYYNSQNYVNRVVHVVTRLDRDTTGLMLFAKHGFAHAMLDKQLQSKELKKYYTALVSGQIDELSEKGQITLRIGRDETSLIKRQVREDGQEAITDYWLEEVTDTVAQVGIQLKTGRTHQIRVHFSGVGCPLLGDSLYDGDMGLGIDRQALHCARLEFKHPFTQELIVLEAELPEDMKAVMGH